MEGSTFTLSKPDKFRLAFKGSRACSKLSAMKTLSPSAPLKMSCARGGFWHPWINCVSPRFHYPWARLKDTPNLPAPVLVLTVRNEALPIVTNLSLTCISSSRLWLKTLKNSGLGVLLKRRKKKLSGDVGRCSCPRYRMVLCKFLSRVQAQKDAPSWVFCYPQQGWCEGPCFHECCERRRVAMENLSAVAPLTHTHYGTSRIKLWEGI